VRVRNRKTLTGVVRSDKMEKTITVEVERRFKHAKYGKYVLQSKRFLTHDEKGEAKAGDTVEIAETRPLSKNKRWRLLRIIKQSHRPEGTAS